jgi:zinc/manganese transport system substrate-binding protein
MGSLSGMVAFSFPSPPLLPFLCRWVNQSAGGMVLGMVMVMVAGCGVEGKSPTVLASVSSSPVASSQASSPLTVVTTIVPLTQFTQAVAGTRARVVQLLPTDTAPHDFQAKPKDLETLAGARVLVENGLGWRRF